MKDYTQFTLSERTKIECSLCRGIAVSVIAKSLNRHKSNIYKEINRNSHKGYYHSTRAHSSAQKRKHRKPYKLKVDSALYKHVLLKLKKGWSPEQISGRRALSSAASNVCSETIYQYIYRHGNKKLYDYLTNKKKKRLTRGKRKTRKHFGEDRAITKRPFAKDDRSEIGHWEGDTIRFSFDRKQSITTLVDRKSRLVKLVKNEVSSSKKVMLGIHDIFSKYSSKLWKTITFDQGTEFSNYYCFEKISKCKLYYADPHSPWQRGTNENTNRRLIKYLPRRSDPTEINQKYLAKVEKILNNTPRKCLGFLTPNEVFYAIK